MNSLFVFNPEFFSDKKNVIYGTDRMALLLHTNLLQYNVGIDAFCAEKTLEDNLTIMGKKVIPLDSIIGHKETIRILIGAENPENAYRLLIEKGFTDIWVDLNMYNIIDDCVWSFM